MGYHAVIEGLVVGGKAREAGQVLLHMATHDGLQPCKTYLPIPTYIYQFMYTIQAQGVKGFLLNLLIRRGVGACGAVGAGGGGGHYPTAHTGSTAGTTTRRYRILIHIEQHGYGIEEGVVRQEGEGWGEGAIGQVMTVPADVLCLSSV